MSSTRPRSMLRRYAAVALAGWLALGHAGPASAYQTFGIKVGNRVVHFAEEVGFGGAVLLTARPASVRERIAGWLSR